MGGTNRMEAFEYPLLVGYRIRNARLGIELKTGASYTKFSNIHATLFSPTTYSYSYYDQNNADSPFRTSYWSMLASINVTYKISEDFSLLLQPTGKFGMGGIYKSDYPINKTYQNYSIGIGIRYQY